ncbi:MAG: hypothetical protein QXU32_01380 [Nitrososphaerales archaeon]
MERPENMVSVLFSVWGAEEGFMKRGREGMLVLTSNRVAFVSKTRMNITWWRDEVDAQLKHFRKSNNTIKLSAEYTMDRLIRDLNDEINLNIPIKQVISVGSEKKNWGSEMKLKFQLNDKPKTYKFAVVRGWTNYPVKDPVAFIDVDWQPWINALKSYM